MFEQNNRSYNQSHIELIHKCKSAGQSSKSMVTNSQKNNKGYLKNDLIIFFPSKNTAAGAKKRTKNMLRFRHLH